MLERVGDGPSVGVEPAAEERVLPAEVEERVLLVLDGVGLEVALALSRDGVGVSKNRILEECMHQLRAESVGERDAPGGSERAAPPCARSSRRRRRAQPPPRLQRAISKASRYRGEGDETDRRRLLRDEKRKDDEVRTSASASAQEIDRCAPCFARSWRCNHTRSQLDGESRAREEGRTKSTMRASCSSASTASAPPCPRYARCLSATASSSSIIFLRCSSSFSLGQPSCRTATPRGRA